MQAPVSSCEFHACKQTLQAGTLHAPGYSMDDLSLHLDILKAQSHALRGDAASAISNDVRCEDAFGRGFTTLAAAAPCASFAESAMPAKAASSASSVMAELAPNADGPVAALPSGTAVSGCGRRARWPLLVLRQRPRSGLLAASSE